MIPAVPAATPVTLPEPSTVAYDVLLLLQVPPAVASLRLVIKPAHTAAVPVMADGTGLMVTVALPAIPHAPAEDCALK